MKRKAASATKRPWKDPRVNTKSMSFRNYLCIFLAMLFFCGSFTGIYFLQIRLTGLILIILSMFTYVVFISLITCVAFSIARHQMLMRPVYTICDAAKRVAEGDYSVRLKSRRKDDRKDEFDVLYDDFNTMTEELASTELMKNDFLSNVSHELKTPLSVIQNYATILSSETLTREEIQEYSAQIGEAASRLTILVTNILQMSRLDNQKIQPKAEPFNLSEALSRCILNYDAQLEEKDLELEASLDQNLILTGDENLLDSVWNNLISNAIKFTPEHGTIRVKMSARDGWAAVSVADTGCGISQEDIRHIFDKFYQADASRATQGNGLGLALVQKIVDLHAGQIQVNSTPGEGSEFTILLPMQDTDVSEEMEKTTRRLRKRKSQAMPNPDQSIPPQAPFV